VFRSTRVDSSSKNKTQEKTEKCGIGDLTWKVVVSGVDAVVINKAQQNISWAV